MSTPRQFDLILVGYRNEDTVKSIAFCDHAFGPKLVRRRILVLNNDELAPVARANGSSWEHVDGSNALGEFSGWQEGLAWRDAGDKAPAGVIFVNDSVVTHRHFTSARRLAITACIKSAPRSALVGFRDRVGGELVVARRSLRSWASTYMFALTSSALERLDGRLYEPDVVKRCVPGGLDEAKFFAELSPDLDRHLRRHLFGGGWYAAGKLTAESADRIAYKARCVIAEKLLSARCEAAAVKAVEPFTEHKFLHLLDKLHQWVARDFFRPSSLQSNSTPKLPLLRFLTAEASR